MSLQKVWELITTTWTETTASRKQRLGKCIPSWAENLAFVDAKRIAVSQRLASAGN
jgi:hypothetical protein